MRFSCRNIYNRIMSNYGSVSRYRLRTIEDWLSSMGSEVARWFEVHRWARSRPLRPAVERNVTIGPMQLHGIEPQPWMGRELERRAVNAIERACVDSMLSACGDPVEVADLSELILQEDFRLSEDPSREGAVFVSPHFWLDRPIFTFRWELAVSWSVPKHDAVRMDRRSCSIILDGWPRLDRIGDVLLEGGKIGLSILVSVDGSVARYRFVGTADDLGNVVCP